jgi:hypothetical protein
MTRTRPSCPSCGDELLLPDGVDHGDAQWLHEQRCAGLFREREISGTCHDCDSALPLVGGMNPSETLWLHTHDCPATDFSYAC